MRFILATLVATALLCFVPGFSINTGWISSEYPPNSGIIKNPHQGISFMPREKGQYLTAEQVPDWLIKVSSIVYLRLGWDDCVNDQGQYDFDSLDAKLISGFREKGLRISIRIMAANRNNPNRSIFPQDKLHLNIPVVSIPLAVADGNKVARFVDFPIFWNEDYIQEHGRLMKALGAWVQKHPEVDHVDFGGMGEWGEMHFVGWSPSQKAAYQLTDEKYLKAAFRMMDQMEEYLPKTQKAICISPFGGVTENFSPTVKLVMDRAVRRGWWLRTDSFQLNGAQFNVEPFFKSSPAWYPWIIEPAGGINRDYYGKPYSLSEYMDSVMRYSPRVINALSVDGIRNLSDDEKKVLEKVALKTGSRLQIVKATLPQTLSVQPNEETAFSLTLRYRQNGSIPHWGEGIFRLRFLQSPNQEYDCSVIPNESLSSLAPGKTRVDRFLVTLPKSFQKGKVQVSLALEDLQTGKILLDNQNSSGNRYLTLGDFSLDSSGSSKRMDLLNQFVLTPRSEKTLVKKNEGTVSITGTDERNWSYANITGVQIESDHVCRMTVRVRARRSEIQDSKLSFKLGIRKLGDTREVNYYTDPYDFAKEGTWQEVTCSAILKEGEEISQCSIEKGRQFPSSIDAEIQSWTLVASPLAPMGDL